MTTETIITNEKAIETPAQPSPSLFKTILWLAVILFLPQIVLALGFGIFFGIQQGSKSTEEGFNLWFASVPVLLTLTLMTPLITLPLLNKATQAEGWVNRFEFWALKVIDINELTQWLVIGFVFWLISAFIGEWLQLPVEQFMLDLKGSSISVSQVILVFLTICIVVPIMEEVVFRGWLFSKIAQTKLGNIGALILSSILFTVIHTQYDNNITLVMIFLLGMLLGIVRYKSGNVNYCIAVHMLFNSLAIIALFFFL